MKKGFFAGLLFLIFCFSPGMARFAIADAQGNDGIANDKSGKPIAQIEADKAAGKSVSSKGPAQTFSSPSLGAKFAFVQAGTFMMGSTGKERRWEPDEIPRHEVSISRSFYMQTTEVTQGQWRKVMGANPSIFSDCGDNCPVENVSWNDVRAFIDKLNRMEGTDKYRLPTEAEWEYAARAGTTTLFYVGDNDLDGVRVAWQMVNGGGGTHAVGGKPPNAWGLYDLLGNVWEWVQDWKGNYSPESVTDPKGPASGSERVQRGGCFSSYASGVRSANRSGGNPETGDSSVGFRLVREL